MVSAVGSLADIHARHADVHEPGPPRQFSGPKSNHFHPPMKIPLLFTTALVCLGGATPTLAADQADAILRGMSAKLAAAKHFTFEATREVDATLRDGYSVPEKAGVHVAVSRPNQFAARSVSRQGSRRIIADGHQLTIVDEKPGHYAQVPMHTSIDQFVEKLDGMYGFTPPLADFALSDVYGDLRRQTRKISYLGTAKVGGALGLGGEKCHRIALSGRTADAELWIAVSDQLPRKLVATFRLTSQPQLHIAFSSWNLNAPPTADQFAFAPSPRYARVEMWSTARMREAAKP